MISEPIHSIHDNLRSYKKKYYTNILLKGSIFFVSATLGAFISISLLEYFGKFDSVTRSVFFFGFVGIASFGFVRWIALPVKQLANLDRELSDEEASAQIGKYFPDIKDKLLNTLQLSKLQSSENQLIIASISQRTSEIGHIPFVKAISYRSNDKYLKRYLIIPIALFAALAIYNANIFSVSTERIIHYNQTYTEPAPFAFALQNTSLKAFRNEDFELALVIEGDKIPESVYLNIDGRKIKMNKSGNTAFEYTLSRIDDSKSFYFEAAGYQSATYDLLVVSRPELQKFAVQFTYPPYLNKSSESLENVGSITVPEGTNIKWFIHTQDAESLSVRFSGSKKVVQATKQKEDQYTFSRTTKNSEQYEIKTKNSHASNKDKLIYNIKVIKDQHPSIRVEQFKDTVLYNYLLIGGSISDDYGISRLSAHYQIRHENDVVGNKAYKSVPITFNRNQNHQNFFLQLSLDSLHMRSGDQIEYYVNVWDNDGVNGPKKASSHTFYFAIPSKKAISDELSEQSKETVKEFEKALEHSKELNEDLKELKEKLQTKRELDWQDKKDIQNVLNEHKDLQNRIEELQEQYDQTNEKFDRFNEEEQRISEKVDQLNKLMESMLDDETRELMKELEKLLQENTDIDEFNKKLQELEDDNETLEKELDRNIEMFKQMQFERKLEEIKDNLEELAEKQEDLSKETAEGDKSQEELKEEQEKLNEAFEDVKEKMKELDDINKTLENKHDMEKLDNSEQKTDEMQQKSSEQLDQGKNKKASGSQQKAADEMKKMAEQLENMQTEMMAQNTQENLDDLRDILENLVTLSFDQESLMKEFKKVKQRDPRFVTLSQKQLKLTDDAKIIEDSLYSLAKRVFEIESFVTREVTKMKKHMNESTELLKQRKPGQASGEQQFAMTSMNNLALLLDEAMQKMQQKLGKQMQGNQMCNNPGQKPGQGQKSGKGNEGKLGDMQKQLNDEIKKLKSGQKTGRQLSESLAKLAARQEMIRRALSEMKSSGGMKSGQPGEQGKGKGDQSGNEQSDESSEKLSEQIRKLERIMEQTEKDLVNKNLTEKTLRRQEEIMTRLLKAENAERQRDMDNKREAQAAKETERKKPVYDDEYIRQKEQQIELLKTIPPGLNPYYKKEVNEYFESIEN